MDKRDITLYFLRFITYYFKALIPLTIYSVTEIVSICHLTLKILQWQQGWRLYQGLASYPL